PQGATLWEAAEQAGIEIPGLCQADALEPVGVCRLCVVDVGERTLAASCSRLCQEGQQVRTDSEQIRNYRRTLIRLLLKDHPVPCDRERLLGNCQLERVAREYHVAADPDQSTSPDRQDRSSSDRSSPVIAVEHQACILCDRCIRACNDLQSNNVIGRSGKGHSTRIAFDLDQPMGQSTCVSCGECVSACPTGALVPRPIAGPIVPSEQTQATDTVCPFCGVGCAMTVHAADNQIVYTEGRDSPVNAGRLCVKGRYGWDYTMHPDRLTRPLIRRAAAYPKRPLSKAVQSSTPGRHRAGGPVDYAEVLPAFREATWDEALDRIGATLTGIRDQHGGNALAGFGSAKCSNEEAFLFQKVVRAGFGTNNVDHCTRLCHASSVAALMETIGSGAVTNVFADVHRADVALVAGSNAVANHPVAATFFKQATKSKTQLILVDVRRNDLADFATEFAQIRPGTDVAFYNAVMHVLITEDLVDSDFITERTRGYAELRELVLQDYAPEAVSELCGVTPDQIRRIARLIGVAASTIVFWGMGISQHTTGTDNARCLISLCLLTGNVGRPGTGLHPLRGQNNVQGASDAGLIPMVYPDYQPVADDAIRARFERAWQTQLDPHPGLTVVEIMDGALEHTIRGMYILGENPFISDPNSNKVRRALAELEFLVVQDIFLTETAEFADVILPASSYFEKDGTFTNTDRRVQLGSRILQPPGEARQDWQILCDIGRRLGISMPYENVSQVFDEFAGLTNNYSGLSHDNLGPTGKLWPCSNPNSDDGQQILFGDRFPTDDGRGLFVACAFQPADELPDDEYPMILNTGRLLEHWHTGTMTRRSSVLHQLAPTAFAAIHPQDLERFGCVSGDDIRVSSRRGTIELQARSDESIQPGSLFIPFHFREAAANVLTTDALDPYGKIPEFKFCAVAVRKIESTKGQPTSPE
ncbi:MAG: formate dehydrogenase subunit alpha, partial [Planctomycetaceae bacterium]